jgi:hypothetical protein
MVGIIFRFLLLSNKKLNFKKNKILTYFIFQYNISFNIISMINKILPNKWLLLNNWNLAIWIFDFDWNILATETQFFFKNKINNLIVTSTEKEYSKYYNDPEFTHLIDDDFESVVSGFRDFTDVYSDSKVKHFHRWPDGLITDIEIALEDNKLSPSFNIFKDLFLTKWRIIWILTARWHSEFNLERWLKLINKTILTPEEKEEQKDNIIKNYNLKQRDEKSVMDFYFWEVVEYMPSSNKHFKKKLVLPKWNTPVIRKQISMDHFIKYLPRTLDRISWIDYNEFIKYNQLSLWFSDDGKSNIIWICKTFAEWLSSNPNYKNIKTRVYFTWDKSEYHDIENKLEWLNTQNIRLEFHEKENQLDIKIIKK